MNPAPGISSRTHRGTPAKPSPVPDRAATPRATRPTNKEAKGRTERREGESSDGVYIKRRRVAGTTDQPPPQAAGGCAQSQKVKAPINTVICILYLAVTAYDFPHGARPTLATIFIAKLTAFVKTPRVGVVRLRYRNACSNMARPSFRRCVLDPLLPATPPAAACRHPGDVRIAGSSSSPSCRGPAPRPPAPGVLP